MADESLHEVQLNGKQLVFLFMVGTVIAVVIFLCGVLVGRGLRPPTAGLELAATDSTSTVDPTQSTQSAPPSSATAPPSDGMPVSASEQLTYGERLESPTSSVDDLREAARPVAEPTVAAPPPPRPEPAAEPRITARGAAPAPKPEPPQPAAAAASRATGSGRGFVVQVMAVNTRTEADAVARRLTAKGYPTFVTTNTTGAKVSYRVRIGTYDTQREAEAVSARLQKEEQFKPWVTR